MWPEREERLLQILTLLRNTGAVPGDLYGYALRARNLGLIEDVRPVFRSTNHPAVVLRAKAALTLQGAAYLDRHNPVPKPQTVTVAEALASLASVGSS